MWGSTIETMSSFLCNAVTSLQTQLDLKDRAGPAADLGPHSPQGSQKVSEKGIQQFSNHGKDTRSPQKIQDICLHTEVMTQPRRVPEIQSRPLLVIWRNQLQALLLTSPLQGPTTLQLAAAAADLWSPQLFPRIRRQSDSYQTHVSAGHKKP